MLHMRPPVTYLIVLHIPLVAQDLALTIAEHDPQAHIIQVDSVDAATAALAGVGRVGKAFVALSPEGFLASPLGALVAARGGRVVLLGHEAESTGPTADWRVLQQPFTTDVLLQMLAEDQDA